MSAVPAVGGPHTPEVPPPNPGDRDRVNFFDLVFRSLDESGVRYCVLHSWDLLPDKVTTDLDMAVHPADRQKMAIVVAKIEAAGYAAVQALNYFVNAYYVVFASCRSGLPQFMALDIIFEHRRGGLIAPTGEELVAERRRERNFWIPSPSVEFTYLLSKKAWKQTISPGQIVRLQELARLVGEVESVKMACRLFGSRMGHEVVTAVAAGTFAQLLPRLRRQTWKTSLRTHPFRAVRYLLEDGWRRLLRWGHPTGLLVVLAGPDGVGKSTVAERTLSACDRAFRHYKVFHWRPGLLRKAREQTDSAAPHEQPVRNRLWSTVRLVVWFLDYWLGYVLRIRHMLARSTLVLFDRYFYDLQVDPIRFRFYGPQWLSRLLCRWIPGPDLLFVLDAPVRTIFARKQELAVDEIDRQRAKFRLLARQIPNARVISTARTVDETAQCVSAAIVAALAERFDRTAHWRKGTMC